MDKNEMLKALDLTLRHYVERVEPVLIERLLHERSINCLNDAEEIYHSIMFWAKKDKEEQHRVASTFGVKFKKSRRVSDG